MTRRRILLGMLITALVAGIAVSCQSNGPKPGLVDGKIRLRYNLAKGQVFKMKFIDNMKIFQDAEWTDQPIPHTNGGILACEVTDVDSSGNLTLKMTYEWVYYKQEGPFGLIEYDSAKTSVSTNPFVKEYAKIYGAIVGESLLIKMTADGTVIAIEGLEESRQRVLKKLNLPEDARKDAIEKSIRDWNSETLKRVTLGLFVNYPDRPLAIGDSWKTTAAAPAELGFKLENTWTLKSRKRGFAFIEIVSEIKPDKEPETFQMEDEEYRFKLSGELKGAVAVDEATGLTVAAKMVQKLSGILEQRRKWSSGWGPWRPMPISTKSIATVQDLEKVDIVPSILDAIKTKSESETADASAADEQDLMEEDEQGRPVAMFGANPQHTRVYETKGVPKLNATKPVKWKFKASGDIHGAPTVVEGVVYFGSGNGDVYALDAATGEEKWRFNVDGVYTEKERWRLRERHSVSTSPALARGMVFFGSSDGCLYALDARTGKEKWKFKTGWGISSSPTIVGKLILFGNREGFFTRELPGVLKGSVYALNLVTGKKIWKFQTKGTVDDSPTVYEGLVFFGAYFDHHLYAVDLITGKMKWKFKVGSIDMSSPSAADGIVYVISDGGVLYAIDVKTGKEKWKYRTRGTVYSSPAVADGTVFFGGGMMVGHLYAVDAKTGKLKWKYKTHRHIRTSPCVAEGIVYFVDGKGVLYAVDAKTGKEKWNLEVSGRMENSDPVVADGVIYFGCYFGNLYAIH